jgi:hypothetical protein
MQLVANPQIRERLAFFFYLGGCRLDFMATIAPVALPFLFIHPQNK